MDQKYVLIIGASSGYGLATAKRLADEGYQVIGASRTMPVDERQYFSAYFQCDVRIDDDCEKLKTSVLEFTANESLFAVVYSSGIAKGLNKIVDGDPVWWMDVFNTNTLGLLRAIKNFIPTIVSTGCFIHIGSISSELNYIGGADYCGSKAATTSIMKNLRLELGTSGIRSVCIEPGYADTNFMVRRFDGDRERAKKGIKPMNTDNIGSLIYFILASDTNVNFDRIFIKPIEQITH